MIQPSNNLEDATAMLALGAFSWSVVSNPYRLVGQVADERVYIIRHLNTDETLPFVIEWMNRKSLSWTTVRSNTARRQLRLFQTSDAAQHSCYRHYLTNRWS